VRIIVGFSAGGGYDAYSRVIGRHLHKHIPGNPTLWSTIWLAAFWPLVSPRPEPHIEDATGRGPVVDFINTILRVFRSRRPADHQLTWFMVLLLAAQTLSARACVSFRLHRPKRFRRGSLRRMDAREIPCRPEFDPVWGLPSGCG
jgi:hypothetical protein